MLYLPQSLAGECRILCVGKGTINDSGKNTINLKFKTFKITVTMPL